MFIGGDTSGSILWGRIPAPPKQYNSTRNRTLAILIQTGQYKLQRYARAKMLVLVTVPAARALKFMAKKFSQACQQQHTLHTHETSIIKQTSAKPSIEDGAHPVERMKWHSTAQRHSSSARPRTPDSLQASFLQRLARIADTHPPTRPCMCAPTAHSALIVFVSCQRGTVLSDGSGPM